MTVGLTAEGQPDATDNAKALSHMGIENRHHWVLGVTFREDDDYLTTQTDKC